MSEPRLALRRTKYPTRPHKCLELHPTSQSIQFCGEFISLSALAMVSGTSISSLSYIFSGRYDPSVRAAKRISKALGMSLQGFLESLEDYVATQTRYKGNGK